MKRAGTDADRRSRCRSSTAECQSRPARRGSVEALQVAAGNQAIQAAAGAQERRHAAGTQTERAIAASETAHESRQPGVVQRKLSVSDPDDASEREAERVAESILQSNGSVADATADEASAEADVDGSSIDADIERSTTSTAVDESSTDAEGAMCDRCRDRHRRGLPLNCDECEAALQRSAAATGPQTVDGDAARLVHRALSGGRPLPDGTRSFFETRMGYDFGTVRVHTDATAERAARAVNARAFTVGSDVVFRSGAYRPSERPGKRLLAHELTHVVQQNGATRRAGRAESDGEQSATASRLVEPDRADVTGTIQRECVGGEWQYEVDGCSNVPDNPTTDANPLRWGTTTGELTRFGSTDENENLPCNNHDKCYQTCKSEYEILPDGRERWTYDWAWKETCDERFRDDMEAVCRNNNLGTETRSDCLDWAERYFEGVDGMGDGAFEGRQEDACGCEEPPVRDNELEEGERGGDWDERTRRYNPPAGFHDPPAGTSR